MLLNIHPKNPQKRLIEKAVDVYRAGGVVVIPTDTNYGLSCDLYSKSATKRLYQLRRLSPKKLLSVLCVDLKQVSEYAHITTPIYRTIRKMLPGPFTIIMNATGAIPHYFQGNRKQVGIRIPDNIICQSLLEHLGHPILIASLLPEEDISPVTINPVVLHEQEKSVVDCVIDVGVLPLEQTTVIDFTLATPEIVREGKGDVTLFKSA